MNLFNFIYAPRQNSSPGFYHYPPGRRKLRITPEQHILKIFFPEQKEGGEDYVVEKVAKFNKGIGRKFWVMFGRPLQFWFMFCCAII